MNSVNLCYEAKVSKLQYKTWAKQLIPFEIPLPALAYLSAALANGRKKYFITLNEEGEKRRKSRGGFFAAGLQVRSRVHRCHCTQQSPWCQCFITLFFVTDGEGQNKIEHLFSASFFRLVQICERGGLELTH
jgi:hypothetical protein